MEARRSTIERIKVLDAHVRAAAKQNAMAVHDRTGRRRRNRALGHLDP